MKIESKALELHDLSFSRESNLILDKVALRLEASEIASLAGPSGAGKTSLLRLIAGFEKPLSGSIKLGDQWLCSESNFVPPEKRGVGIVFQDFALFPHLTVKDNLNFGLFREDRKVASERVQILCHLLSLGPLLDRFPHELSGGQQQRVAIGRALAPEPSLLLLDEPFSQLDPELREELIESLGRVMRETKITTLLVTHHQEDAFDLSDKLGVLNESRLEQWGNPYDLYHNPKSRFVADFIGKGVFLDATFDGHGKIITEIGTFSQSPDIPTKLRKDSCKLLVRPDDVLHVDGAPLKARLIQKRFRGSMHLYTLELQSGKRVLSYVPSHHNHSIGEWIGIQVDMDHVNIYDS